LQEFSRSNSKKREDKMPPSKKRLSKSAKEALKVLEGSKLLKDPKTTNEQSAPQNDKAANSNVKTSVANKMRPGKKRG
jgi:hypothetical protein